MPSICLVYTDPFFLKWDCKQLWHVWGDKQSTDVISVWSTASQLILLLVVSWTAMEQNDRMWFQYWNRKKSSLMIPGFWLPPHYLQYTCKMQLLSPNWTSLILRSKSMTVFATPRHPVPILHQPVADDVKYWFACPPISPRLGFAVKFI